MYRDLLKCPLVRNGQREVPLDMDMSGNSLGINILLMERALTGPAQGVPWQPECAFTPASPSPPWASSFFYYNCTKFLF